LIYKHLMESFSIP